MVLYLRPRITRRLQFNFESTKPTIIQYPDKYFNFSNGIQSPLDTLKRDGPSEAHDEQEHDTELYTPAYPS